MKITKLKRTFAKYGIGNPLNQLIYTADEIKEKKREDEQKYIVRFKAGIKQGMEQGEKIAIDKIIGKDTKLSEVLNSWVLWNKKKLSGDDFANKFGIIFDKECHHFWMLGSGKRY